MARTNTAATLDWRDLERRFGSLLDALTIDDARSLLVEACHGKADVSLLVFRDDHGRLTGVNRELVLQYLAVHPDAI